MAQQVVGVGACRPCAPCGGLGLSPALPALFIVSLRRRLERQTSPGMLGWDRACGTESESQAGRWLLAARRVRVPVCRAAAGARPRRAVSIPRVQPSPSRGLHGASLPLCVAPGARAAGSPSEKASRRGEIEDHNCVLAHGRGHGARLSQTCGDGHGPGSGSRGPNPRSLQPCPPLSGSPRDEKRGTFPVATCVLDGKTELALGPTSRRPHGSASPAAIGSTAAPKEGEKNP